MTGASNKGYTAKQLEEAIESLISILETLRDSAGINSEEEFSEAPVEKVEGGLQEPSVFFDEVRDLFHNKKLKATQVAGMEAKIKVFASTGSPLSHAAYKLATSFHETAQRMQPVREGLSASDAWRKRNLRYYPWYGRGDVQLTWERNYRRADNELGLEGSLIANPDRALEPVISAKIINKGMDEGWFGPKPLSNYLPNRIASHAQFRQARRTVNIMDKASMIASYAEVFQKALVAGGYTGDK